MYTFRVYLCKDNEAYSSTYDETEVLELWGGKADLSRAQVELHVSHEQLLVGSLLFELPMQVREEVVHQQDFSHRGRHSLTFLTELHFRGITAFLLGDGHAVLIVLGLLVDARGMRIVIIMVFHFLFSN